jgi:hypothetical protein
VQEAPAATLVPQLFVWPNPAVVETLEMVAAALPVLLTVTGWAAELVPTAFDVKLRLDGLAPTTAVAPCQLLPLTVAVKPLELLMYGDIPERRPVTWLPEMVAEPDGAG